MPKILIDQPSRAPSRKIWATILAGAVTGSIMAAAEVFWPGMPMRELAAVVDTLVVAAVASAAGYLTRDAA